MKISVVIPVYNVECSLARCLDSVLLAAAAAKCDTEIICVNDGSTDGSSAVLSRYSGRLRVVEQENRGLGIARNAGLDRMTGDYVMFVDSDDWIPEHAISTFAAVAEASGADLVVSTSYVRDDGRYRESSPFVPPRRLRWEMRPCGWISGRKVQYCAWNKLYRAELFRDRRFPETLYEDFPVVTGIFCQVGTFAAVAEPLYAYSTAPGAASIVRSPFSRRKMGDSLAVVRQVLELDCRAARVRAFARRQAVDGLSSTVGQVWRSRNMVLAADFVRDVEALFADFPWLRKALTLKARWRLWRCRSITRGWIAE